MTVRLRTVRARRPLRGATLVWLAGTPAESRLSQRERLEPSRNPPQDADQTRGGQ